MMNDVKNGHDDMQVKIGKEKTSFAGETGENHRNLQVMSVKVPHAAS